MSVWKMPWVSLKYILHVLTVQYCIVLSAEHTKPSITTEFSAGTYQRTSFSSSSADACRDDTTSAGIFTTLKPGTNHIKGGGFLSAFSTGCLSTGRFELV